MWRQCVRIFTKTMSDSVVFFGVLDYLSCDNMFSHRWWPQNNMGFMDYWIAFWGKPGLIRGDAIISFLEGAAIISCNPAKFVIQNPDVPESRPGGRAAVLCPSLRFHERILKFYLNSSE